MLDPHGDTSNGTSATIVEFSDDVLTDAATGAGNDSLSLSPQETRSW